MQRSQVSKRIGERSRPTYKAGPELCQAGKDATRRDSELRQRSILTRCARELDSKLGTNRDEGRPMAG